MFLSSCSNVGVRNPSFDEDELYIQVDTNIYKVVWVTVSKGGSGFYLMVPKNSDVKMPQTIGSNNSKSNKSVIIIK